MPEKPELMDIFTQMEGQNIILLCQETGKRHMFPIILIQLSKDENIAFAWCDMAMM